MKSFTILAKATALLAVIVSAQDPFPIPPSATSLPSAPPLSQPEVTQYISSIPSCWIPCIGGAIKYVCPNDDSWECACNAYFNTTTTDPDFIQIGTYDPACANANGCSPNVGTSDGGEQGEIFLGENIEHRTKLIIMRIDISGLLVNICIALPEALTTAIASALTATATATPTSTSSPRPTKNAATNIAFRPWELLVVPFAVFGGLALL
jgi:hypothetical protein